MKNSSITHNRFIVFLSLLFLTLLAPLANGAEYGKAGSGEPELGSILVTINAGRTAEGRSAGNLVLHTETPSPDNATPKPLKFNTSNSDSEVIEKDGALRQIVAPEAFIDIVTESAYAYNVNFYLRDELGTKANGLYAIATGAEPYATWRIENPDASTTDYDRLKVSKITGSSTKTYEYIWDEASKTWTLNKGGGLQVLSKKTETTSDGKVITETTADNAGMVVEKTVKTYKTYAWGSELIKSVTDPNKTALTETRTYYDVTGENGYGHLKMLVKPDGSWERYTYDAQGRKTAKISPWLDSAANSVESASRVVYYDYTIQDPSDANLVEDKVRPRLVTEKILGQVVKKTFYVYKVDSTTKERIEIMKQAASPAATYADPANLTTTTVSYPFASATAQSGKTKTITKPDNTMETYTYEYGQYSPSTTTGQPGAFTPGTGKTIRSTVTMGILANPQGIANKTTREISVTDEFGHQVLRETQVYTGSAYERIGYEVSLYDERGRLTKVYYPDSTYREVESDCCNRTKEVERDGITSRYTDYDALGRLKTKVREGSTATAAVSTTFTYDAAGRQISQTESGGSLSLTSRSEYDSAGRLKSRVDQSGLITNYSYSANGLTETVILPGGATKISTSYLDGRTKSVTGTAGTASYYTYGVNPDGSQWTKTSYATVSSPTWEKTTADMLGRTVKTERPGTQGTEIVASYYDTKGRLIRTTNPGKAATLYQYDELGNQIATALDVNGNGQIDAAGSDRINAVDSSYTLVGNDWWQEKIQKTYATINNSTPTTVSTSRSRLTGLGSDGLSAEVVNIDIHGNQTVQRTYINRSAKQVENSVDYPDATNEAGTLTENGLVIAERDKNGLEYKFSYDALGRRTGVTAPRTGTTVTHYNNKGQVDYVIDPVGNKTSYAYDLNTGRKITETDAKNRTTRFSYTTQGQLWRTWGGAVYPVQYGYDNLGRMIKMSTYRSTSVNWNATTWPTTPGTADTTTWNYLSVTGLLSSKVYADGKGVTYTYGAGGLLKTRTWARKNNTAALTTTYFYDSATGELTKVDYSDTTKDLTFIYDRLGRKTKITDAVGTHAFTYNNKLQLATETISGLYSRTITHSYSQSGMLGRDTGLSMGTNYDVDYGYEDTTGRLNSVSWLAAGNTPQTALYAYLANSSLPQSLTIGKRQTIYGYEPKRDLLTSVQNNFNGASISGYGYTNDTTGQRTQATQSGREFTESGVNPYTKYTYNTREELSTSTSYKGTQQVTDKYRSYQYDPIGNRTNSTEGRTPYSYTANNINQYSAVKTGNTSAASLTYDADGNLTVYSGWTSVFDAENRLVTTAPKTPANGSKATNFLYDYLGRRVQKTVYTYNTSKKAYQQSAQTMFVYDGWNLLEEIAVNQPSVFYVWGLDLSGSLKGAGGVGGLLAVARNFSVYDYDKDKDVDKADLKVLAKNQGGNEKDLAAIIDGISHTHLYLYDANGNVGQAIDATTGALKAKYEYDPFGNLTTSSGVYSALNPFRFSTKYTDNETGLAYYGYRYYSPNLGRWINRDPIGERGGSNLYGMINNNPINFIDLFGLQKLTKSGGEQSLRKGLSKLESVCGDCCKGDNKDNTCCNAEKCKQESRKIIDALVNAWSVYYGTGPAPDVEPISKEETEAVGGYWCWDWAHFFEEAVKTVKTECISFKRGMAGFIKYDPNSNNSTLSVHYYLKVYACKQKNECKVSFDDGFFDGENTSHLGQFPVNSEYVPQPDSTRDAFDWKLIGQGKIKSWDPSLPKTQPPLLLGGCRE